MCLLPGPVGLAKSRGFTPHHHPRLGLFHLARAYQDCPQAQDPSTFCEGPFQLPTPQSWLLSVRLWPEQPLRAPA